MTLNELNLKRKQIYRKYAGILERFYDTCINTKSLTRALSAYRNYVTFAELTGMNKYIEYSTIYMLQMGEMLSNIEELAQKE